MCGIFQARILGWFAVSSSRGSSLTQGSNQVSRTGRRILLHLSHHVDGWILTLWCLEFVPSSYLCNFTFNDTCCGRFDCRMGGWTDWAYYTMSEFKEEGILFIAPLYHNLISFLPWKHARILHWWHLTGKTYVEFSFVGRLADQLCLSQSNTNSWLKMPVKQIPRCPEEGALIFDWVQLGGAQFGICRTPFKPSRF